MDAKRQPARIIFALVLVLAGCQPAMRYPPLREIAKAAPAAAKSVDKLLPHFSWLETQETPDLPILFVAGDSPQWASLKDFWNHEPPPAAGMRTIHFGQSPLGAAAGLILADRMEAIKIKVPAGLPDPTPNIPTANPPTYGKWKLGKALFFDARLLPWSKTTVACAFCHHPNRGFSQLTIVGKPNPASLINAVFNKQQFRDGRVVSLEEVIVRQLEDERPEHWEDAARQHIWGGMFQAVKSDPAYVEQFSQVFGVRQPTQDAIAKAVATYLRTILSGDSLFDQAWHEKQMNQAAALGAEHFAPHLSAAVLERMGQKDLAVGVVAESLVQGQRTFLRAGCGQCHPPPLFTDAAFHNIGTNDLQDLGRLAQVPIGLKENRLRGAFRTPSLRALPRTAPYFHDGSKSSLREVAEYFNSFPSALAEQASGARRLNLTREQVDNLVLFLTALDGAPVNAIVAQPSQP